jgi:hypothetical protein
MASKQENYLKMHHPSIYKKMKKGGKVEYPEIYEHEEKLASAETRIQSEVSKKDDIYTNLIQAKYPIGGIGRFSQSSQWGTGDEKQRQHVFQRTLASGQFDESGDEIYLPIQPTTTVKGGKRYQKGGYNTDTVPAMLTPGEVVLNQDQQERLGNMMAGGGKAGGGQERAAALFKHIGVPGYQKGIALPDGKPQLLPGKTKEEYAQQFKLDPSTVSIDTLGHTPKSLDFRIKGTDLGGKEASFSHQATAWGGVVGRGQEQLIAPDWRAQVDSLKSTGKMSDLRKGMELFHEKTKGLTPEEIIAQQYTRKAEGGLVDKKDALMSYYMGGKVCGKKKK